MSKVTNEVEIEEVIVTTNDELEDFDFEDEDENQEEVSSEDFKEKVVDSSISDAFDKAEEVEVTVDTVDEFDEFDEFEEAPMPPQTQTKTITASVSPKRDKEAPAGTTKATITKKEKKKDYVHPQFIKRKAGDKFLKDEEIINLTAEFKLDDVVITLVVKKSKTVKAFLCDETTYLKSCEVTDDVTTITLENEAELDERAAIDIIRKANVKYDLGVQTVSPKGDKINTRTLGLKVARELNKKLKVKAETV